MIARRIAMARLEAALIRAGFAAHGEVTVRIGKEDADEVRREFEAVCVLPETAGGRGSNLDGAIRFEELYGEPGRITHVVASADVVNVPKSILGVLEELKATLPSVNDRVDPKLIGWELCADRNPSQSCGIILNITTAQSKAPTFSLESYADAFSDALGLPVRLEYGLYPSLHESWSTKRHDSMSLGVAIGAKSASATLTMPVKWSDPEKAEEARDASPVRHLYLTAGHPFIGRDKIGEGATVFQPPKNTNQPRAIGAIIASDYQSDARRPIFFDSLVIEGNFPPSWTFSSSNRRFSGIWGGSVSDREKTYIFGAASGYKEVKVEYFQDVTVTVLTSEGDQVLYKDVVKFCLEANDTRPASNPGDSGAPLLVKDKEKYHVAGLVFAGDPKTGKVHKSSYAIPIRRTLRRFNLDSI